MEFKIVNYYDELIKPTTEVEKLIKDALANDDYSKVEQKNYILLEIVDGVFTGTFTVIYNTSGDMFCEDYSKKDIIFKTKNGTAIYHQEDTEDYIVIDEDFQKFYNVDDLNNLKYLLDKKFSEEIRICSDCGVIMQEGYCIYDGEEYYCSDDCLYSKYSEEEYEILFNNEEAYYTEWE